MYKNDYDTLSQATNGLLQEGFDEDFKAIDDKIIGYKSKKKYLPTDLKIVKIYRFEGMSNPQDDTVIFAIEANDGTKGTLIMSYSAQHNQNIDLIKKIPEAEV